jgi:hypothetical protein
MEMIIGLFPPAAQLLEDDGGVRRRDDNPRGKGQNVRADSCAGSLTAGTSSSSRSPPDNEFETDRRRMLRRSSHSAPPQWRRHRLGRISHREAPVAEWVYAQRDPAEELAQLHFFSFKKRQPTGEIEFVITVKEFASRNALQMRFYAQADKEVNQRIAPFRPFGWGDSLLGALTDCMNGIRQNPYEPE